MVRWICATCLTVWIDKEKSQMFSTSYILQTEMRFRVLTAVLLKVQVFWDVIPPPFFLMDISWHFKGSWCLQNFGNSLPTNRAYLPRWLESLLFLDWVTLQVNALLFFITLGIIYQTKQCNIPEHLNCWKVCRKLLMKFPVDLCGLWLLQ